MYNLSDIMYISHHRSRIGPRHLGRFGRSDTRKALRRFFEVDAESITVAALSALSRPWI